MTIHKLISTFDGNDQMEIEVADGECPETVALETLGWFLTGDADSDTDLEDDDEALDDEE